jgi:hypothetical protein
MLVHDSFVFIHNQKCGGTFVRKLLSRELEQSTLRDSLPSDHAGWASIPEAAKDRPVLCFVRNPWDWYVSWYEFKQQRPETRGKLFDELSDNGRHDFAQTVRNACAISHPVLGAGLCEMSFKLSVGAGLGSSQLTIGRLESLVDDLERFLREAHVELPEGAFARARAMQPINASRREHYSEYYENDLRALVGSSCKCLIDRWLLLRECGARRTARHAEQLDDDHLHPRGVSREAAAQLVRGGGQSLDRVRVAVIGQFRQRLGEHVHRGDLEGYVLTPG